MASKSGAPQKKLIKKTSFVYMQKLTAAVSLIAFVVIIAAGLMGEAGTIAITYRAAGVMVVIGFVSRIIIRILASYEEMNSDKT